ncbi:MAG: hypothetical protein KJZ77_10155 [Anaerolineales bacterium]|nr:hypothetical protein [Anaerolineales bacterium]
MDKLRRHPILILLIINLIIGLMIFRTYGLSWDEPLFYEYGDALRYAYSPANWFNDFDLTRAFGASASDHANRGPAYLLLASPLVSFLRWLGLDIASAWHLTNFLTFNLGVYLLYRLASRWVDNWSALAVAALFSFQPLLWGHAFINPKDIPFLVFFLGSVVFGFEMVDQWIENRRFPITKIILASFFLGIATSIRVLGPLAAVITILYFGLRTLVRPETESMSRLKSALRNTTPIWLCAVLSIAIMFAFWPYLWLDPLGKFIEVFIFMSDNPTQLNVLFAGENFRAGEIPRRYLPVLLAYTLTEPFWLLTIFGGLIAFWKSENKQRLALALLALWFLIPVAYVLLRRPAMYDGYRHFLFILPPLFIFAGFAFQFLFQWLKGTWQKIAFLFAILAFGILPIMQLQPYQYAYYNNFAGGVDGVFRSYETEYWLTCYREAVLQFNEQAPTGAQLFVRREPYIAAYYASNNITIRDFRTEQSEMQSGDFYLANSRSNEDLRFLRDEPSLMEISRMGATFCVIKQMP